MKKNNLQFYSRILTFVIICFIFPQLVRRKQGEILLEGSNPSSDTPDDTPDEGVECGVDIVLNHRLVETYAFGDKKSYTAYLRDYMKK